MKNLKMKILSVILVISLLFSLFAIQASASDIEYTTVAHHYFGTILNNIPQNIHGSCVLVAISMILSFYDIYWNDAFVFNDYEDYSDSGIGIARMDYEVPYRSPGIKLENRSLTSEEHSSISSYMNFAVENAGNYLHMKLISICMDLGFYTNTNSALGLSVERMLVVLDTYFDQRFGEADYYSADGNYAENLPITIHMTADYIDGCTRQTVLNDIENQIEQGNPVIYSGFNGTGGHTMVAYALDNNDISLHKGTMQNMYDKIGRTEYSNNISAVWIEINEDALPHQCSGSYTLTELKDHICSCKAYRTLHPKHTHEMGSYMSEYDSNKHKYRCKWGCIVEAPHAFRSISQNNSYHGVVCDCGYTVTEPHIFIDTANPRYMRCSICGYTKDNWGPGQNVQMGYEDGEEKE